jgi:hypothetical protein
MPARRDDEWIRWLLRRHADRHPLDAQALRARVLADVHTAGDTPASPPAPEPHPTPGSRAPAPSPRPSPRAPRVRPLPALLSAALLLVASIAGSVLPALAGWTGATGSNRAGQASHTNQAVVAPDHAGTSPTASGSPGPLRPENLRWRASGPLRTPRSGDGILGFDDPTVVRYDGRWHVFATVSTGAGDSLVYFSFTDWPEAASATPHYLDGSPLGGGYRAAPHVFYFAPQKLWYLVYQTGNASYSTNPDLADPDGWSPPQDFYPDVPDLVRRSLGGNSWTDMWVICDTADCYLFSSDGNGHLFRSRTTVQDFPNRMGPPMIAAQDATGSTPFTGSSVYRIADTDRYLLLSPAEDDRGHRYIRSWTSPTPDGDWTPLAAAPGTPFAGDANTTFPAADAHDVGPGELVRTGADATQRIDPCQPYYFYRAGPEDGGDEGVGEPGGATGPDGAAGPGGAAGSDDADGPDGAAGNGGTGQAGRADATDRSGSLGLLAGTGPACG